MATRLPEAVAFAHAESMSTMAHRSPRRLGVLLSNLGSPDAPTPAALRRYLRQFLSDPRVIDLPRWKWWPILHGIVLRVRPRRSAALYRKVWTEHGAPLLVDSEAQRAALAERLAAECDEAPVVALGMRYGSPSLAEAAESLRLQGCRHIVHLPLYPQYSRTTTASNVVAANEAFATWPWMPELRTVDSYHDDKAYIDALAASVRETWQADGEPDRLLISFHGIPERYFRAGDPYPCLCRKTGRLLREALGLPSERAPVAFQSRFGREPWVKPYTDELLREWGQERVGSVDVICPGFAADCLETLEEIAIGGKELFEAEGGGRFRYLPALGRREDHIALLAGLVRQEMGDWVKR